MFNIISILAQPVLDVANRATGFLHKEKEPKLFVTPIRHESVGDTMNPRTGTGTEDEAVLVYIANEEGKMREIVRNLMNGDAHRVTVTFFDGKENRLPWKLDYIKEKAEEALGNALCHHPNFPDAHNDPDAKGHTHIVDVFVYLSEGNIDDPTVTITADIRALPVAS